MNKGPKIIGIRFGDNDFHLTCNAFMLLLSKADWPNLTKAKIVELFNRSAPGIYWVSQNGLEYSTEKEEIERMNKYIQIEESQVYFDEEVNEFMTIGAEGLNGDFFVLDMSNPSLPHYLYST